MDRGDTFTQVFPGMNPVITLGTSSLTFGDIEVGKTGSASVSITNDGPGPLVISSIATDVPGLTLADTPVTIAPGETSSVVLSVSQEAEGAVSGTLTFFSNDPVNSQISLDITATGVIILADARADFDGDGDVDFSDFLGFAGSFGKSDPIYDIDASGLVDFTDFLSSPNLLVAL
jgi:hypothetical protein